MKQTLSTLALTAALALPMTSCFTMTHRVGDGGSGTSAETERQWWILWGLVELNDVDSQDMADGASDYTVTTQCSALDIVINIFTAWVTVSSREIEVRK